MRLAVAPDEIVLYNASIPDCIWAHDRPSYSVSFSPDSCQLVSVHVHFYNCEVELLDIQTGSLAKSFKRGKVLRTVFSRDGTRVLSGESCFVAM